MNNNLDWKCPVCGLYINKELVEKINEDNPYLYAIVDHCYSHIISMQHTLVLSQLFEKRSNIQLYANPKTTKLDYYKQIFNKYNPRQSEAEILWTLFNLEKIMPKTIIEIGSWEGGTLSLWEEILRNSSGDKILIAIDPDPQPLFFERYNAKYINKLKDEGIMFHFIKGKSQDESTMAAIKEILGTTLPDFIYIDGDHEIMYEDFMKYFPLLREGGMVGIHDFKMYSRKFTPIFYGMLMEYKRDVVFGSLVPPSNFYWIENNWATAFVWNEKIPNPY